MEQKTHDAPPFKAAVDTIQRGSGSENQVRALVEMSVIRNLPVTLELEI
jgi:hypothetical protein